MTTMIYARNAEQKRKKETQLKTKLIRKRDLMQAERRARRRHIFERLG